ncbi:hypothetical protein KM043_006863 [Ampulex compressa]|nr:hypothetical protein KM043_006863 [Ampulex compressa]
MFARLRLPVNQFLKGISKGIHIKYPPKPCDVTDFTPEFQIPITMTLLGKNSREVAPDARVLKFDGNISGGRDKLIYEGDDLRSSTPLDVVENGDKQVLPVHRSYITKYRLSSYRDPSQFQRDRVESELVDLEDILDPYRRIQISQDLNEEMERRMEREKSDHGTSAQITWNLIT